LAALEQLAWSGACDALAGGDRRRALWELGVAALRFSFGKENTPEDVEALIGALPKIVEKVRHLSAVLHR